MADTLTPLLLDAKQEYTSRMKDIIAQRFFHYFQGLYESCDDDEYIIQFQDKLREIPYWSSSQISVESAEIVHKHPYFENLMAAVIVTYVKVLSSIRLSEVKPNVQLKLPTVDEFVHELYKQAAGLIYANPFIFEEENVAQNFSVLMDNTIEQSIRRLIPFDDILASYLSAPDPVAETPGHTMEHTEAPKSESESESDDDDEDIEIQTDPREAVMEVNGDKISSSDDDDVEYRDPVPPPHPHMMQDQFPIPSQGATVITQPQAPQHTMPPQPTPMDSQPQQPQPQPQPQPQIQTQAQAMGQHLVPGVRDML